MVDSVGLPTWVIIFIIVGAVFGAIIIILATYCHWRLYQRCTERPNECKSLSIDRYPRRQSLQDAELGLHGRPMPSSIDSIPTGEAAEPLNPLDWPPPSPPLEDEI